MTGKGIREMAMESNEEKRALALMMRSVANFVYADGKADLAEVKTLIGLTKPLAGKDADIKRFVDILEDIAADGIVSAEESRTLSAVIARLVEKFASADAVYDARTLGCAKMGLLGVQHLFAMFGATVLVPLLTGLSVSSTLLFAGVGTLLFHLITKRIVPAFLGSSFAFLAGYFALTGMEGKPGWEGLGKTDLLAYASVGVAVAALVYMAVSALVKSFGVKKVMRFFPPVVTGPIIIGIGLVLSPVAVNSASTCWPVALAGIVAVIVASVFGKGMVKIVPILIGVLTSYAVSILYGNVAGWGPAVDFSKVAAAPWVGLPFHWNETVFPLFAHLGDNVGRMTSAILIVAPLCAATIMEHVGDVSAIGSTISRNLFERPGLHRTLLGDGLATFVAAVFGAPANTTYGENTGVLSLSKVYDPRVIRIAAVLAVILAFCPKFAAVITTLPAATVGGVSFVLYGMISAVGVRNLVEHQVDFSKPRNMLICAVSIVCTLGISFSKAGAVRFSLGFADISLSGLAVGALMGILLNAILPGKDYQFSSSEPNIKDAERFGG